MICCTGLIPILNPFDVLAILAIVLMRTGLELEKENRKWLIAENSNIFPAALGATALLLSTISIVRIVHHVTGVSWETSALFDSDGEHGGMILDGGV